MRFHVPIWWARYPNVLIYLTFSPLFLVRCKETKINRFVSKSRNGGGTNLKIPERSLCTYKLVHFYDVSSKWCFLHEVSMYHCDIVSCIQLQIYKFADV